MISIELTEKELALIKVCIEFIKDCPIGMEAVEGWNEELEGEDLWELSKSLEEKL